MSTNTLADTKLTPSVTAELDLMTIERLTTLYGPPRIVIEYAKGQGNWKPGDGEPDMRLADDPASAQAAGRCLANRTRYASLVGGGSIHPNVCGWCDYPAKVLLQALDHAVFVSRYVVAEYGWWPAKGNSYARPMPRTDTYENPTWARFFALDIPLRRKAIEAAASVESGVS